MKEEISDSIHQCVLNRNIVRRWNYHHNLCWARFNNFGGPFAFYWWMCGTTKVRLYKSDWCSGMCEWWRILKSHQPCQGIENLLFTGNKCYCWPTEYRRLHWRLFCAVTVWFFNAFITGVWYKLSLWNSCIHLKCSM